MIIKIADNILSPLGYTTEDNFKAVSAGKTMLRLYEDMFDLPEPFFGSLFDRSDVNRLADRELNVGDELTFFEKICVLSIKRAIERCNLRADKENVIFILSTTKGNVELLEDSLDDTRCYLSSSAEKIAGYFGNPNQVLVVSNACISGVCAQITAVRALLGGKYKYAVVVGADVLSKFIVSGFQSFKALSPKGCKPYDKERNGLNLGEAAGTIILKSEDRPCDNAWQYAGSSIHNDVNHISGPSRTGEGSYRVLKDITQSVSMEEIAFINVHGTSTAYNDEMESIAIHRAGLDNVAVNGLKGYYGHTLGAAGIIETILSMKAVDNGVILATKGFTTQGTTYPVNISNQQRAASGNAFIKILSGFGGSNAGISYRKGGEL